MGKFISGVILFILLTSICLPQENVIDVKWTIPDSLTFQAIHVGSKAKANIFMISFETPFVIVSQDFDGTITLVSTQPFKVRYYDAGNTPIKMYKVIHVQIRNMRIINKKLEIIEQSMR